MTAPAAMPAARGNDPPRSDIRLPVVAAGTSIPRILHQIYYPGWDNIPNGTGPSIAGLRAANPEWEYRFYDAAAAEAFILDTYGQEVLDLYLSIDRAYYAARADLLRYLLCYSEGGVYFDLKSTATRPLDTVLNDQDVFILSQWAELRDLPAEQSAHPELRQVPGCEYLQWFIASAPGHPFLRAVLERVLHNLANYRTFVDGVGRTGVLRMTGPIAYTLAIHEIRSRHTHRYVNFDTDLGFLFSIFGDHKTHRRTQGNHYSDVVRPVVIRNRITTALAAGWFGHFRPFLERRGHQLKRMFG